MPIKNLELAFIPIPFYFNRNVTLALPIIAIRFHRIDPIDDDLAQSFEWLFQN